MNIDSAIQLVDDALSELQLTRKRHIQLQTAIDLVRIMRQEFKKLKEEDMARNNVKVEPETPEDKKPIDNAQDTPVQ